MSRPAAFQRSMASLALLAMLALTLLPGIGRLSQHAADPGSGSIASDNAPGQLFGAICTTRGLATIRGRADEAIGSPRRTRLSPPTPQLRTPETLRNAPSVRIEFQAFAAMAHRPPPATSPAPRASRRTCITAGLASAGPRSRPNNMHVPTASAIPTRHCVVPEPPISFPCLRAAASLLSCLRCHPSHPRFPPRRRAPGDRPASAQSAPETWEPWNCSARVRRNRPPPAPRHITHPTLQSANVRSCPCRAGDQNALTSPTPFATSPARHDFGFNGGTCRCDRRVSPPSRGARRLTSPAFYNGTRYMGCRCDELHRIVAV